LDAGFLEWISTRNRCEIFSTFFSLSGLRFCPLLFASSRFPSCVLLANSLADIPLSCVQSFEALNQRAVAVVVDPIQSVKGKVVIDAFRLINPQLMMMGQEPRQTTSNIGHLNKPSIQVDEPFFTFFIHPSHSFFSFFAPQALIHGLGRHYYSIAINYRKNELEQQMLLNLHKKKWTDGLTVQNFVEHGKHNEKLIQV
jgi:26S proteasome regulatory subunit N11